MELSCLDYYTGKLPEQLNMRITLWYDNTLLKGLDGDHEKVKEALRAVVDNTKKTYFQAPTLDVKINPLIEDIRHVKKDFYITDKSVKEIFWQNSEFPFNSTLNVYFVESGEYAGLGPLPQPCPIININQYKIRPSKPYYDQPNRATQIFAHEVGHNFNMRHYGGPDKPCDKMGRMDGAENGKWSHCSNEEFEEWYRRAGHTCGIFRS